MATSHLQALLDRLIVATKESPWVDPATKRRARGVVERILAKPDRPPPVTVGPPPAPTPPPPSRPPAAADLGTWAGSMGMAVVQRKGRGRAPHAARPSPRADPDAFYTCVCGAPVKRKNRAAHEASRCPERGESPVGGQARRPHRTAGPGKARRLSSPATAHYGAPGTGGRERDVERGLDATAPYARAYREGGRFGSHPSHDDYGEDGRA